MERSAERGLPCLTRYSLLGLSKNLVFSAVKHFIAVTGGGGGGQWRNFRHLSPLSPPPAALVKGNTDLLILQGVR